MMRASAKQPCFYMLRDGAERKAALVLQTHMRKVGVQRCHDDVRCGASEAAGAAAAGVHIHETARSGRRRRRMEPARRALALLCAVAQAQWRRAHACLSAASAGAPQAVR
jgi:hypothetical protein